MSVARGKATDFSCVTTKNMTMKGANYLEKLLDNQPVEWKKLGEVATFYGGLTGKSKEDFNKGNAYYISYKNIYENIAVDATCLERVNVGEGERQHTVKYGDVLITGSSENLEEAGMSSAVTFESETNIYLNSFSFGIRFNEGIELSPEFTKYLFRTNMMRKQIMSTAQGVTRFNVSKKRFATIEIPLPPLSVQSRIVEMLDKFTSLEAELEAELDCRKRQYIYYRELLLLKNPLCLSVPLGQLGEVRMCKRILKNQTTEVGDIPFYKIGTFGKQADAFISRPLYEEFRSKYSYPSKGDLLISASGTIGRVIEFDGEDAYFQDSNIVWLEHDGTKVLNRYLYHCYQIADWKVAKGGTITRLYNDNFKKTEIPLPPLSEQARIVEILDKFDTLTNSISEGLPLEIQLRKQQYEYYREQLLAFPHS